MFAPVQGDFHQRAPVELLRLCEEKRFTGLIEVEGAQLHGSVLMRAGEVATLQLEGAQGDALDAFLALQEGRYTLRQHVATLDGGLSRESTVRGSLAEHGPVDVLRFCEDTGLSGEVRMMSAGRRLEVHYDAGVMTTIAVDGQNDTDLDVALSWKAGEFVVNARAVFDPPKRLDESGLHFLSVVEVALTKVVAQTERVRETEPERPIPLVTRRRRTAPPRETDPNRTVQIFFLHEVVPEQAPPPAPDASTRHARLGDQTAELVGTVPQLAAATRGAPTAQTVPQRPAQGGAGAGSTTPTERRRAVLDADTTPLWVWIGVGAAVGAVVVALLAKVLL